MKSWTAQEDKILLEVYEQTLNFRRWKKMSQQLGKRGVTKTQYECRERYINKLDPKITVKQWTFLEIGRVFDRFDELGSHWSTVQTLMPNRSQSSIKNKFYGTLRNLVRSLLKYKGIKSKKLPDQISTNRLMDLYKGQAQFAQLGSFIPQILRKLSFRISPRDIREKVKERAEQIDLLCKILMKARNQSNHSEISRSNMPSQQFSDKVQKYAVKDQQSFVHISNQRAKNTRPSANKLQNKSFVMQEVNFNQKQEIKVQENIYQTPVQASPINLAVKKETSFLFGNYSPITFNDPRFSMFSSGMNNYHSITWPVSQNYISPISAQFSNSAYTSPQVNFAYNQLLNNQAFWFQNQYRFNPNLSQQNNSPQQ